METDNSSSSSMSGVSLVAKNNLLAESKAQGPKTNANIEYGDIVGKALVNLGGDTRISWSSDYLTRAADYASSTGSGRD